MKICIVIPAYRVKGEILAVIDRIGPEITKIYVVDDCCPLGSGKFVESACDDPRVSVIFHSANQGVGAAVMTGYAAGMNDGMDVFIKIDGDGQMDPALVTQFIAPIEQGDADYTKGNRFFFLSSLKSMPLVRKLGNTCLSFINKVSSGYWDIMDPTNGYTAIHRTVLSMLPLDEIDKRYFFESDMLFRLGTLRAVVRDIPMDAVYGNEESGLNVARTSLQFSLSYIRSFFKRLFYTYFLRDFNAASIELILGGLLVLFSFVFGLSSWIEASSMGEFASAGTVMLAAIPLILGFQMLLAAVHFDINNIPTRPLQLVYRH